MVDKALSKEDIIATIEGRGASRRVPCMLHLWVHPESFCEREPVVLQILSRYPMDMQLIKAKVPKVFKAPADDESYRWSRGVDFYDDSVGLDERAAISNWAQMDGVFANPPNPNYSGMFPDNAMNDGRYRLGVWWHGLFEQHWALRGMTNALMDYYTDSKCVHRLFRELTDFYLVLIERAAKETNCDGVFTSDDFGIQNGPFFSLDIFREFFKPYYKELIEKAHSLNMHFWLHSCGNIEQFLPDFIEIGLDVIHPIQKHTMDERRIASNFGSDICIWAGFDVQQTLPWGTPEDVRREVRFMMDTYNRPNGRFMITSGNGINCDCPLENLEALLDEIFSYGQVIAKPGCSRK